ncbi:MAG: prephenate dehydratase domain-containing protein [Clostridia bacterium]|nr:prephenate dehydratase domain-containing protein [Clostridia bacterium]
MKLDEIRNKIDNVDDKIAKLYVERMELSKEVGLFKKENNIATENTLREKEIINRVTKEMPEDIKLFGKQVFCSLFDTSKAYQSQIVSINSSIKNDIISALKAGKQSFPNSAIIACQGVSGAYSNIATEHIFSFSNIMYFKDFDGVFNAVEKGFCQFGVLPIENSSVGSVNKVYDLMRKHKFYIVRSIKLKVQHYLLANAGIDLKNVKEIFSHEQAIGQCAGFLKELGDVKISVCDNTALAAKMVSESGRKDVACISSRECAGIYGLSILAPNIQDSDSNFTRFIAISKKLQIFEDANKISIMVNLPHEVGSLNKLLNRFSTLGLNLTKIESRPMPNSMFEFAFYFDFEAKVESIEVQNLVAELENTCDYFSFLGSYHEIV